MSLLEHLQVFRSGCGSIQTYLKHQNYRFCVSYFDYFEPVIVICPVEEAIEERHKKHTHDHTHWNKKGPQISLVSSKLGWNANLPLCLCVLCFQISVVFSDLCCVFRSLLCFQISVLCFHQFRVVFSKFVL